VAPGPADTPFAQRVPPTATRRCRCDTVRLPRAFLLRTKAEHFERSFGLQQSGPIERHRGFGYCNQSERKRRCKERQQLNESWMFGVIFDDRKKGKCKYAKRLALRFLTPVQAGRRKQGRDDSAEHRRRQSADASLTLRTPSRLISNICHR
jgi:hypothetical protein